MSSNRTLLASLTAAGVVAALLAPLATPAQAQVVAQASIVSDDPAGFTPNVLDGKVEALAQVGGLIVAGGSFSQVQGSGGGTTYTRDNIVAFSATTGAISTSFAPNVAGEVYDIEPAGDGTSVYVVGRFTQVNGTATSRVARIDVTTGAKVAGFAAPSINGTVKNVDLVGGRLLIGGSFSSVGGATRTSLASLDPATGALTGFLNLAVSGTNNGGGTQVIKMAASPDGSRLVAIGNFTSMGGQQRLQIAMLSLAGPTATLANWSTGLYTNSCASVFDTYMRDLDFSPDGSYFVVSTTGAYGGPDSPCDVITRWESSATGSGLEPTWRDYTGGDTTYAVAVTGAAVYIGGHFRWLNNPWAGDAAGPGAVPREGIAALDPATGLPLSWNPGRARGVGVFDLLSTPTGLWVGSDTDRIGGETHRKVAYFPLAGGTSLPAQKLGALPDDVYLLGRSAAGTDPDVLYRVNAGGPQIASADDGPDWMSDASAAAAGYKSGDSNAADWGGPGPVNASVPSSPTDRAPSALFASESWGPSSAKEMGWHFTVPAGEAVDVRLYLANRCSCTSTVGGRVFDVAIDGQTKLSSWDLVARYGDQVGAMESFPVTSDGTVDITFGHLVENPLVNGIEIVRAGTQPNAPLSDVDQAEKRSFDGTTPGPASPVSSSIAWGSSRGAFLVDNTLYVAFADGTLTRRTFDGDTASFGPASTVNLYGGSFGSDIPNLTGLTYAQGRIYYTLSGDITLHWRWFSPQSGVVGAMAYDVTGSALDGAQVRGLFLSGTDLYAAQAGTGDLLHASLSGEVLTGPVTTADSTVDWVARSLFLNNSGSVPPSNQPPTAVAAVSCDNLDCHFSSAGSNDPEGGSLSYSWDFGDGATSTLANPDHTYASGGDKLVTLTVTDPQGASDSEQVTAQPSEVPTPPTAAFTSNCSGLTCTFTNTSSGTFTSSSWAFGDGGTSAATSPTHSYAGPGTYTVSLTVDGTAGNDVVSEDVTVSVPTSTIDFRGAATSAGNSTSYQVPSVSGAQSGDVLLLFVSSAKGTQPASAPAGWTLVGSQADGSDTRTTLYRRVGTDGGLGTVTWSVRTKTQLTVLAYSGASAVPTASVSAAKTSASSTSFTAPAAAVATDGSAVVSFWAIRVSGAATWTVPAGTTERSDSSGSGGGQVGAASADELGASTGTSPARTATASASSAKGIGWTVVLGPA